MIYKTDYHVHTTYSDGRSVPEDYIASTVEAGLKEIGFSDHITLLHTEESWTMGPSDVGKYLDGMTRLKNNCSDIKVRIGLEVDFFPGNEKELSQFLSSLTDMDYIIGSVHYMGDKTIDLGPEFYKGKNFDKLFKEYFELIIAAVSSGLFDIIGHCDLIRIFGYRPAFDPESLYRKLASAMRKHDVAFEINTNGRNRPVADFYPDRKFLHVFHNENVPVCVNSDAHMPGRIGQYFDEVYDLLRYVGFAEMATFENRERRMIPF